MQSKMNNQDTITWLDAELNSSHNRLTQ